MATTILTGEYSPYAPIGDNGGMRVAIGGQPVAESALVEKVVRRQIDPRGKVIQGAEGLW